VRPLAVPQLSHSPGFGLTVQILSVLSTIWQIETLLQISILRVVCATSWDLRRRVVVASVAVVRWLGRGAFGVHETVDGLTVRSLVSLWELLIPMGMIYNKRVARARLLAIQAGSWELGRSSVLVTSIRHVHPFRCELLKVQSRAVRTSDRSINTCTNAGTTASAIADFLIERREDVRNDSGSSENVAHVDESAEN
jgi:hypothetical protein